MNFIVHSRNLLVFPTRTSWMRNVNSIYTAVAIAKGVRSIHIYASRLDYRTTIYYNILDSIIQSNLGI